MYDFEIIGTGKNRRIRSIVACVIATVLFIASAPVFAFSPTEVAKLLASDGAKGDRLGWAVSVSGDTAVVEAKDDDDNGNGSGSAYVFVRDGTGNWTQQAKLTASDGDKGDHFGDAVSVSGDTIVIGVSSDDDRSGNWPSYRDHRRTSRGDPPLLPGLGQPLGCIVGLRLLSRYPEFENSFQCLVLLGVPFALVRPRCDLVT